MGLIKCPERCASILSTAHRGEAQLIVVLKDSSKIRFMCVFFCTENRLWARSRILKSNKQLSLTVSGKSGLRGQYCHVVGALLARELHPSISYLGFCSRAHSEGATGSSTESLRSSSEIAVFSIVASVWRSGKRRTAILPLSQPSVDWSVCVPENMLHCVR